MIKRVTTCVEMNPDIKAAADVYLVKRKMSMGRLVNGVLAAILSGELEVRNSESIEEIKGRPTVVDLHVDVLDKNGKLVYSIARVE